MQVNGPAGVITLMGPLEFLRLTPQRMREKLPAGTVSCDRVELALQYYQVNGIAVPTVLDQLVSLCASIFFFF